MKDILEIKIISDGDSFYGEAEHFPSKTGVSPDGKIALRHARKSNTFDECLEWLVADVKSVRKSESDNLPQ